MTHTGEYVLLNGSRQFISIHANQPGLPILLYLHGGPGDAALPLVVKHNLSLADHFTLVIWEQRGAGKSYYPFGTNEDISFDIFSQDLHMLVTMLLERMGHEKLYLVGHSWGSALGLKYASTHPDLLHAYVGCGQVVNMAKGCLLGHRFAVERCRAVGDSVALERLKQIDPTYATDTWLEDLLFTTKQIVKHKGSSYGRSNYNDMVVDTIFSRGYSIWDVVKRQKGATQSIKRLWPELMTLSFEELRHFDIPILFVEGRHDAHVSSALARSYFDTITSDKYFHWFEKSAHFPQWSEASKFTKVMAELLKQEEL